MRRIKEQILAKIKAYNAQIAQFEKGEIQSWSFDPNILTDDNKSYSIWSPINHILQGFELELFFINQYVRFPGTLRFLFFRTLEELNYDGIKVYYVKFHYKPSEVKNHLAFSVIISQFAMNNKATDQGDYILYIDADLCVKTRIKDLVCSSVYIKSQLAISTSPLSFALFFDLMNNDSNYPYLSSVLSQIIPQAISQRRHWQSGIYNGLPYIFNLFNPNFSKDQLERLSTLKEKVFPKLRINVKPRWNNNISFDSDLNLGLVNVLKYLQNLTICEYYDDYKNDLLNRELFREINIQNPNCFEHYYSGV